MIKSELTVEEMLEKRKGVETSVREYVQKVLDQFKEETGLTISGIWVNVEVDNRLVVKHFLL